MCGFVGLWPHAQLAVEVASARPELAFDDQMLSAVRIGDPARRVFAIALRQQFGPIHRFFINMTIRIDNPIVCWHFYPLLLSLLLTALRSVNFPGPQYVQFAAPHYQCCSSAPARSSAAT